MMARRQFIRDTIGGALALAAAPLSGTALAQSSSGGSGVPRESNAGDRAVYRGVNLGGWLVLEKWMVPTVYQGFDVPDEYGLCLALGDQAKVRLEGHRQTFITAEDFRWMKSYGLNAVRLPVGYWVLEAPKPFVPAGDFVSFALDQAAENGLQLVLDLHGAPGSQNGWDHSGRSGPIGWDKDPNNINETVRILGTLAQHYGKHPALLGIELLNEPSAQIPIETLKDFYQRAYVEIRKYAGSEVAVVFHDSFRAMAWQNFMKGPDYSNVIIDTHLYQSFTQDDAERSAREQLVFALNRQEVLDQMQREELPTFVGEWSLALPGNATKNLTPFQSRLVSGAYADAQLLCFEGTRGWFFWSYKLESDSVWNFRHCVERGWLPRQLPS